MLISNWIIYFIGFLDKLETFALILLFGGIIMAVVSGIGHDDDCWEEEEQEKEDGKLKMWLKRSLITFFVGLSIFTVVPSRDTANIILVNSVITEDNVNFAGKTAEEVVKFFADIYVETKERVAEIDKE